MDLITTASEIACQIEDPDARFHNLLICGMAHAEEGNRASANDCLERMRSILPVVKKENKLGRVLALGWVLMLGAQLQRKDVVQELVDESLKN